MITHIKNDKAFLVIGFRCHSYIVSIPYKKGSPMSNSLYPLTASQRMLQQALDEFGTAQVLTIGVCVSIHSPVDFPLLKKCLAEEAARLDCLRIQFTKADSEGGVKQYIVPELQPAVTYLNLKDKSGPEIKDLMTGWSSIGFEQPDTPMLRFVMVSLPNGWNGVYLCIDHRIMDSLGLIFMMNDTFGLYCHYLYGTPLPGTPASYEEVLQADLKQEQALLRCQRDRAFWEQLASAGEPIYTDITGTRTLEQSRIRHSRPGLKAADRIIQPMDGDMEHFTLSKKETVRLQAYCRKHAVSMTNVFLMAMRTALSFQNDGETDISIRNYVSRRFGRQSRTCGGCRIHCYPCRTVIAPETAFLDGIRQIASFQNNVYRHSNYDPSAVDALFADTYKIPPFTTYEGAALTCQPLSLALSNPFLKHVPLNIEWFSSKADIQKLYLTVMQAPQERGLDFHFKYQTAMLGREDIVHFYSLLTGILSLALRNEEITVKEIMTRLEARSFLC